MLLQTQGAVKLLFHFLYIMLKEAEALLLTILIVIVLNTLPTMTLFLVRYVDIVFHR